MAALNDIDGLLKDYYAGPVRDQLNNELMIFDLFNRRKMSWTGRKVIMPVRTARNGSGAFRAEGIALPGAGNNTYLDLNIECKYLYGRMSLTGPAIAQAKASQGAFLNALESELDGAMETVKNVADAQAFVGGGCVGFIHDQAAGAVTDHPFSGNLEAMPVNAAAPVNCKIVRLSDYAVVQTTTVRQSANAGQCLFGAAVNLSAAGHAIGTRGAAAVVVDADPAGLDTTLTVAGIYTNLAGGPYANPEQHFTVDRNAAAGATLRSIVRSITTDGQVSSLITPRTLQFMLDEISTESGEMPNCMIAHYIFRQEYLGLLTQSVTAGGGMVAATAYQKDVDNGDAGFRGGFTFNGIPLKVSRHCGKGLLVFLKTDSWTVTEVEDPGFADLDGNVLSRSANTDAYEAFVRYYYNLVCSNPNRNGILVALSY
jgi:hypothetical protein